MSLGFDLKKAFRRNRHSTAFEQLQAPQQKDSENFKARYILGRDTRGDLARTHSTSSTSTKHLRSVGFSDSTTAAGSADSAADTNAIAYYSEISRKPSTVLVKRQNRKLQSAGQTVQSQPSNDSLRSFYDRNKAPIQVSQQTSESSSRDFALRRSAPSIISTTSQEMEQSRQLKFFSRTSKPRHDTKQLSPYDRARSTANSSQPSSIPSVDDARSEAVDNARSEAGETIAADSSASQLSMTKGNGRDNGSLKLKASAADLERPFGLARHHEHHEQPDPVRAKINVRRPKVGAKNWFDSFASDSDEEPEEIEPQLQSDFEAVVTKAFEQDQISTFPVRASSRLHSHRNAQCLPTNSALSTLSEQHSQSTLRSPSKRRNPRRPNPLQLADLTQESVLCLTSSDDEDTISEPQSPASYQELARREIRGSLMNASIDANIEIGQAIIVQPKKSGHLLRALRGDAPAIPERTTSRMVTNLKDKSSDTLTQNDLLRSFPHTPSDPTASIRGSLASARESTMSTKVMVVTRQEEQLIAAVRLKKCAMKRAQAKAHRQSALYILEHDSDRLTQASHSTVPSGAISQAVQVNPRPGNQHAVTDSVTTIQTSSTKDPSIRSSGATYLTETSIDYHTGQALRPRRRDSGMYSSHSTRDTFLSAMTTTSPDHETDSLWTPTAQTSHVVVLDPMDRQMTREEIPSQLFMERPFIGWERALQIAH